jgi:hypothetical protein
MLAQSHFSNLLTGIYDAATDFSRWEDVLRNLTATLGGNGAVLGIREGKRFSAYVAPLTEPAFLTSYNAYYHKISPLTDQGASGGQRRNRSDGSSQERV